MTRQEVLLNLTLVTIIGALGYTIYDAHRNPPEVAQIGQQERLGTTESDEEPDTETTYNRETASKKYPAVGNTEIFKFLVPPTPSPPPPTPKPTETPNIAQTLNAWKVLAVLNGVVTVEDVVKTRQGAEGNPFDMKVGDAVPMDIGGGQMKTVKLESVDEKTNPDQPTATFSMEGTSATRTLKMGEEAGANANTSGTPPPQQ